MSFFISYIAHTYINTNHYLYYQVVILNDSIHARDFQ